MNRPNHMQRLMAMAALVEALKQTKGTTRRDVLFDALQRMPSLIEFLRFVYDPFRQPSLTVADLKDIVPEPGSETPLQVLRQSVGQIGNSLAAARWAWHVRHLKEPFLSCANAVLQPNLGIGLTRGQVNVVMRRIGAKEFVSFCKPPDLIPTIKGIRTVVFLERGKDPVVLSYLGRRVRGSDDLEDILLDWSGPDCVLDGKLVRKKPYAIADVYSRDDFLAGVNSLPIATRRKRIEQVAKSLGDRKRIWFK